MISWLPAAHIAERAAHHYLPIVYGFTITSCPNPRDIVSYLPQVKPNWFFAVPRIWEKMKAGLEARLASLPAEQRTMASQAIAAAREKVRLEQAGRPVPADLADHVARADASFFAMVRGMLGLDEAVAVNVGAAPTPPEVLEFFHAIGLPLGELWGMSETTGSGTVNPPGRMKIGTVGPPVPGVEIKLGPDSEVFIRGDVVMAGYRNLPEKTAEVLDAAGWLATGDVGQIDADGYLRIVDRKKELIINSAGKNMSPANIEGTLKGASPLIGQVCVIGDRRAYNTALVVLDADFAPVWAAQQGLTHASLAELAAEPAMRTAVQEGVERANALLSRVEQVKKFHIVAGDWPPGGDELTPTMKLKRRPIAEKYAREIDGVTPGSSVIAVEEPDLLVLHALLVVEGEEASARARGELLDGGVARPASNPRPLKLPARHALRADRVPPKAVLREEVVPNEESRHARPGCDVRRPPIRVARGGGGRGARCSHRRRSRPGGGGSRRDPGLRSVAALQRTNLRLQLPRARSVRHEAPRQSMGLGPSRPGTAEPRQRLREPRDAPAIREPPPPGAAARRRCRGRSLPREHHGRRGGLHRRSGTARASRTRC